MSGGRPRMPARWADRKTAADGSMRAKWVWRETRDARGRSQWFGPATPEMLKRFRDYVRGCWAAGKLPDDPKAFFDGSSVPARSAPSTVTARVFVGRPSAQEPGDYWKYSRSCSPGVQTRYERLFERPAIERNVADVPMSSVATNLAQKVVWQLTECPECRRRADSTVEDGLLRPDHPPFDGDCTDHRVERKRTSIVKDISQLRSVWDAAKRAGLVESNPWSDVLVPEWYEPETNDDLRTALNWTQLQRLIDHHPDDAKVIPAASSVCMLRASEFWGLCRGNFPPPPEDPDDDPELLWVNFTHTWNRLEIEWRTRGKTKRAVGAGVGMFVPGPVVRIINDHLRRHMPPNPAHCKACRDRVGIWRDEHTRNPHEGCGLAEDTRLVYATAKGRPHGYAGPYYHLTGDEGGTYPEVLKRATRAASLDEQHLGWKVTHRVFRSTGATLLIHWGNPISEVKAAGRWSESSTQLERTYHRMYPEALELMALRANRAIAMETGTELSDDADALEKAMFLETRLALAAQEVERLRELLAGHDIDPAAPPPLQVVVSKQDVNGVFVDLDRVEEIVRSSRGIVHACRRLGLTNGSVPLLRRLCEEQGWPVPDGRSDAARRDPFADRERVRAVVEDPANASLHAIGVALGYARLNPRNRARLIQMADEEGWNLPDLQSVRSPAWLAS